MPLTTWPTVLDEVQTIRHLADGWSLARFGDGENALMRGAEYRREPRNPHLAEELCTILATPDPRCLVGIPSMNPRSPKHRNWLKRQAAFLPFLSPYVAYGSAFVTRPDSAPWIATSAYAVSVEQLWRARKVVLVCEPTNKLLTVVPRAARKLEHLTCPSHGAYAHIDTFERAILRAKPDLAILAHGVSATVLAHRLACRGVQALDLGSIGGFLARMLHVQPLPQLYPVVVHHPQCATAGAVRRCLEAAGFVVYYCDDDAGT